MILTLSNNVLSSKFELPHLQNMPTESDTDYVMVPDKFPDLPKEGNEEKGIFSEFGNFLEKATEDPSEFFNVNVVEPICDLFPRNPNTGDDVEFSHTETHPRSSDREEQEANGQNICSSDSNEYVVLTELNMNTAPVAPIQGDRIQPEVAPKAYPGYAEAKSSFAGINPLILKSRGIERDSPKTPKTEATGSCLSQTFDELYTCPEECPS